ncbi:MAG: TIGR01459 family HAD-type hydrolase, partial [Rhizobiales bacterium]|nr:TIGR01459 family HAD-type hydrolase [Hyphomicrobiales bacterium]
SKLFVLENAYYLLCTFLAQIDDVDLNDYLPLLNTMLEKKLPFICSNPDRLVDVGGILYYCAGAMADMYEEIGGEVIYTGKPHDVIYQKAIEKLEILSKGIKPQKILVIGDSLSTDVPGANRLGSDMLYVADGIHAREFERLESNITNADIFSKEFETFISQKITQEKLDVKYFIEQLA